MSDAPTADSGSSSDPTSDSGPASGSDAEADPRADARTGADARPDADAPAGDFWGRLAGIDRRWLELLFYGFLLVWMAWLLVVAWEWSWRDKLIPFVAGVPTVILLVAKLAKAAFPGTYRRVVLRTGRAGSGGRSDATASDEGAAGDETSQLEEALEEVRDQSDVTRPQRQQVAYAVRMTAWAMALPLLMYVIGFANALVLFVLAFGLRFYDSPRDAVLVTLVFSAFMYIFFYQIIGMQPWTGVLGVPSIVDLVGLG